MAGAHPRLDAFLASIERQAYRFALHYTRDRDDALDLVQDAMLRLARRYAERPDDEYAPLFFGILRNRVRDWQRREIVRSRVFFWRSRGDSADADPVDIAPGPASATPEHRTRSAAAMVALDAALTELPTRQREVFLMRTLDGMDVQSTAAALGIGEGSVKTHHSRAVHRLRKILGEHWDG